MTQRNDKVTATVQVGGMINYTPCSIEVGEVTTLPAGSDATVTNSGNEYEAVFDFGIPQGAKGDTGETGATGKSAYESAVEQGYEGTEEEFATSLTTVDTKAAQAAASATAAAGSATSASNSATSASNSATTATTKASEASASATAAAASATSAGSNATAAQNYVTQAAAQATAAATSATNAATSATNAAASASNAASMASSASTSASTATAVLSDPDFVAVAGAVEDISTVATNISDVTSVATSIADVSAVADDLTDISAVADDLTNIDTVATNISDVNATGQAIADVSAVADNLTDISLVANDLENIDEVATRVAEWQKPADWVDIRSGALPNSVYFLAAHKADFSDYNEFGVMAHINTSGDTYDVYVDGIKYQTVSGNYGYFSINWQNANLSSGYDVTYPQALRTHIVRITPTDPTKHFNRISLGGINASINQVQRKSVLWVHCNLNYSLNCTNLCGTTNAKLSDSLLEAITSRDSVLKCSGITQMIAGQCNLRTIPILDLSDTTAEIHYMAYRADAQYLKKIHIRNLHQTGDKNNYSVFTGSQIKEIILENSEVCWGAWTFDTYCIKLEKFPQGLYHPTNNQQLSLSNFSPNLEDTFLDLSSRTGLTRLNITGKDNARIDGLKGITVSPSAPFTEATSPQINIPKTGLDRAALIALFKSMPYNVGYTVVGSPTITSGVASGFSENNYYTLPITLDFNNDFEFSVKTSVASVARFQYIFGISNASSYAGGLKFDIGSSRVQAQIGGLTSLQLNQRLSAGNIYIIKWKRTANTGYLGLFNQEGTLIDETSVADYGTAPAVSSFQIGVPAVENKDSYLAGSIDFNNTYINSNGVPWFTGKAAMTKTCSVVGCTGTANLTAEDKAIATDKGWALTLS